MSSFLDDLQHEFRRHKQLAESAMVALDDPGFFHRPGSIVNPVALIVKHLAGNLRSRWTDFLTTDGEKPDRDRDSEFQLFDTDTRASLMAGWENGWSALLETITSLNEADLDRAVMIRQESQSVRQALLRALTHAAYHTGQILYIVRMLQPDSPWLMVAPGQSSKVMGNYRSL